MKLLMVVVSIVAFLIDVLFWFWVAWIVASSVTSVIKAGENDCGKTYHVEKFVNLQGDWFCPEE